MSIKTDELISMHVHAIQGYADAADPKPATLGLTVAYSAAEQGGEVKATILDKARNIFAVELASMSDQDAGEVLAFYNSPTGQKELRAAEALASKLREALRNESEQPNAIGPKTPKMRELLSVMDLENTLRSFADGDKMPVDKILDAFVHIYGSALTDNDVDELIEFHKSEAGKRYSEVSKSAGTKLSTSLFS